MRRGATVTAALLAAAVNSCGGQKDSDPSGGGTGGRDGGNAGSAASEPGAGGEAGDPADARYPDMSLCEWTTNACALMTVLEIGTAEHLPCEAGIASSWGDRPVKDLRVSTDCDLLTFSPDGPTQGWTYDRARRVVVIRGTDCNRILAGDVERIDVGVCGSLGI